MAQPRRSIIVINAGQRPVSSSEFEVLVRDGGDPDTSMIKASLAKIHRRRSQLRPKKNSRGRAIVKAKAGLSSKLPVFATIRVRSE